MSFLLDTHVWIWSQQAPEELGRKATRVLSDPDSRLCISPISTLEIARLNAGGRIKLRGRVEDWVRDTVEVMRCQTVEMSHTIAAAAYGLPDDFHPDPADRILVATAREHGLTLLTADRKILDYGHVESQDARS